MVVVGVVVVVVVGVVVVVVVGVVVVVVVGVVVVVVVGVVVVVVGEVDSSVVVSGIDVSSDSSMFANLFSASSSYSIS